MSRTTDAAHTGHALSHSGNDTLPLSLSGSHALSVRSMSKESTRRTGALTRALLDGFPGVDGAKVEGLDMPGKLATSALSCAADLTETNRR